MGGAVEQHAIDLELGRYAEDPDGVAALLRSDDVRVRRGVASSPHAPLSFLIQLSFDRDRTVRQAVLDNPVTPASTRARLQGEMGRAR